MSLPVGFAPAKEDASIMLPVGLQLVAGLWQEQKILDAGYAWELANDWKRSNGHGFTDTSVHPKL